MTALSLRQGQVSTFLENLWQQLRPFCSADNRAKACRMVGATWAVPATVLSVLGWKLGLDSIGAIQEIDFVHSIDAAEQHMLDLGLTLALAASLSECHRGCE